MSRKVYPPPSVETSAAAIPYTVTQLRIGIDDIVIREYDQQQYQIVDIDDKYITVKFSPRSTLKYTYEDFEASFDLCLVEEEVSIAAKPFVARNLRYGDEVIGKYDGLKYTVGDVGDRYVQLYISTRALRYSYKDLEADFDFSRTREEVSAAYHAEKESLSTMNKALFKKGDRVRRKDAHNLIHIIVSDPDVEGRVHTTYEDNKGRLLNGLAYVTGYDWELIPTYPGGWQNVYPNEINRAIYSTRSEADFHADRSFRIAVKEHCADGSTILHKDV